MIGASEEPGDSYPREHLTSILIVEGRRDRVAAVLQSMLPEALNGSLTSKTRKNLMRLYRHQSDAVTKYFHGSVHA